MTIGEKIQRCRKEQKMSQEDLASRLGVSRQAVSKWELNESVPDTENVVELGRIFRVSLDYLLKAEISEPEETACVVDDSYQEDEKRGGTKNVKWYRRPAVIVYFVVCILIITSLSFLDSPGVGLLYVLDITFLWGIGYLVWLCVKALKKYVRK
ncbi:XRE family transcriptional regulator [Clostridium sp. AF19-22AC]|uniref:helix-turn-helix domain-containing protein n=1 Tax=Clostridia TaxID=186801 RepID=UPI000E4EBE59|nr:MULTISPECIES: helix-turn-helix transcriptional regulator [Clostridia]RHR29793.1 XRE family transcriptional regulator [Clostridium sp. AF19-22AC]